jgi:HAMP domain-containing protein
MLTRKKMNFRTRLILLFLLIGIIPITLLGYLHFHYANKILKQQAVNQLISLREDRKAQLQSFFKHLRLDVKMLSDHRLLKDILSEYIAAYNNGGIDGEKFKAVDKRYHARCLELSKDYGYEDMLFVNNEGNVLITVKKRADWGVNLINGIYSDTSLAECFKNVRSNIISIVDFKEYPPSGAPAAFIGAPMIRREQRRGFKVEEKIGVLIIQISADQINAIIMRKDGLEDTGETCLIGKDFFKRSDLRFFKESSILKVKVETAWVSEAIEGRSGYKEDLIDYRGEPVSIAYGPAEIEGLDWVIVAKKDRKEILKPAIILRNQSLVIALFVVIGVVLADLLFVEGIRKPIRTIIDAGDKIAAGDLDVRVPVETGGDIGKLSVSINNMAQNLMESSEKIERDIRLLEKKWR